MQIEKDVKAKQTPLIIISGFLGAGKTTLLNNLLEKLNDKKVGLIVNEFGEINVDAKLVDLDQKDGIVEINNGSIFCSCLSGSFVESIASYKDLDLDYLLVESSGMSRPKSLGSILSNVAKITDDAFDFKGMICVVDALNFNKVVQSLNSAREQVAYSDLVIINKIELVDKKEIEIAEKNIKDLNSEAEIVKSNYAVVDDSIFDKKFFKKKILSKNTFQVSEIKGEKPDVLILSIENSLNKEKLNDLLLELLKYSYRIKGFIELENGKKVVVNSTPGEIEIIEKAEIKDSDLKLVVFTNNKEKIMEIIKS